MTVSPTARIIYRDLKTENLLVRERPFRLDLTVPHAGGSVLP